MRDGDTGRPFGGDLLRDLKLEDEELREVFELLEELLPRELWEDEVPRDEALLSRLRWEKCEELEDDDLELDDEEEVAGTSRILS